MVAAAIAVATVAAAITRMPEPIEAQARRAVRARINRLALLAVALLPLVSCHETLEREYFLRSSERSELGSYVFTLPLPDSLRTYDLSFFTRMTASERKVAAMKDTVTYHVALKSPSGIYYTGSGCFLTSCCTDTSPFSRVYVIPFRQGFRPSEYGDWLMYLTIRDEDEYGFDGFGIKLSKK